MEMSLQQNGQQLCLPLQVSGVRFTEMLTPKRNSDLTSAANETKTFGSKYSLKPSPVNIWNPRPAKAQALAAELGAHVVAVETAEEAVRGADIIVTVTNSSTPVLQGDWVKPGAHINAVGSCRPDWQELDPKLMQKAAVYVESRESALKESGDIILSGAAITAEIGEVILGKVQAKKAETTIFKSLGIALEDAASAALVMKLLDARDAAK